MSDTEPTRPLDTAGTAEAPTPRRSPALWWVLGGIGALLVIVIVLLVLLLFRPAAAPVAATATPTTSPSASSSPTATATEAATGGSGSSGSSGGIGSSGSGSTPTPTPTGPAPAPIISRFQTPSLTVACVTGTEDFPAQLDFDIPISWTSANVEEVYVGIDTEDPRNNPFAGPLPGNSSITMPFSCYGPHIYSIVGIGPDGQVTPVGTFGIRNSGDPNPNG